MSIPRIPARAQLVLSILAHDWDAFWPDLMTRLEEALGPADLVTQPTPFTQTGYYDRELGAPLLRRMVGFDRLVEQDRLADIKLLTNRLEALYRRSDGRRICDLDPGLVTQERLVLATGKNFTHRVYLRDGIWADLTLIYQGHRWITLPWTFPDYRTEEMQRVLTSLRDAYRAKLTREQREIKEDTRCPRA